MSPKLRSSLKCIKLIAVAKTASITKQGSNKILQSFMEEVKVSKRYTILFSVSNCSYNVLGSRMESLYIFRGTITLYSGDNLPSHYIGCFKSPSGALRKCRICMGTDEDMKIKVSWISIALSIINILVFG